MCLPPCVSRHLLFVFGPRLLLFAFGPRIRPLPRTLTLHAARLSTRCLFPLQVRLSPDHLPFLMHTFERQQLEERTAPLPYIGLVLPGVPHYIFIGSKRTMDGDAEAEDANLIELSAAPWPEEAKKVKRFSLGFK